MPSYRGCCGLSLGLRGHCAGWDLASCLMFWAKGTHAQPHLRLLFGCPSAADPFDPLLLPSGPDTQPCSKPDLFGEFLNPEPPAAPTSFPSTHSAPPPACSTDFLHLGKCQGRGLEGGQRHPLLWTLGCPSSPLHWEGDSLRVSSPCTGRGLRGLVKADSGGISTHLGGHVATGWGGL